MGSKTSCAFSGSKNWMMRVETKFSINQWNISFCSLNVKSIKNVFFLNTWTVSRHFLKISYAAKSKFKIFMLKTTCYTSNYVGYERYEKNNQKLFF